MYVGLQYAGKWIRFESMRNRGIERVPPREDYSSTRLSSNAKIDSADGDFLRFVANAVKAILAGAVYEQFTKDA